MAENVGRDPADVGCDPADVASLHMAGKVSHLNGNVGRYPVDVTFG